MSVVNWHSMLRPWMATAWQLTLWVVLLLLAATLSFVAALFLYFFLAKLSVVEASLTCLEGGFWSFYGCYDYNYRYLSIGQIVTLPSCLVVVYWATPRAGLSLKSTLPLSMPRVKTAVFWVSVAVIWLMVEMFYYHWANHYRISWQHNNLKTLVLAMPSLFLVPVYEEMVFRGFLLSLLMHRCRSTWVPIMVISILFTAAHGFDRPTFFYVSTFLFSVVLCHAKLRTGTLWVPIMMHMAVNLAGPLMTSV